MRRNRKPHRSKKHRARVKKTARHRSVAPAVRIRVVNVVSVVNVASAMAVIVANAVNAVNAVNAASVRIVATAKIVRPVTNSAVIAVSLNRLSLPRGGVRTPRRCAKSNSNAASSVTSVSVVVRKRNARLSKRSRHWMSPRNPTRRSSRRTHRHSVVSVAN